METPAYPDRYHVVDLSVRDRLISAGLWLGRTAGRLLDINPTRPLATHGDHLFETPVITERPATIEQNYDGDGREVPDPLARIQDEVTVWESDPERPIENWHRTTGW